MELGAGSLIGAGLDGGPGWQGAGTQRHGRGPVLWCDTADVLGIPDLRLGRGRVKHRVHVRSCPARGEIGGNWMGRIAWHDSWGAGTFSKAQRLLYLERICFRKGRFPHWE